MNNTVSSGSGFLNSVNDMSDEHFNLMVEITEELNCIASAFMHSKDESGENASGSAVATTSDLALEKMMHNKQSLFAIRALSSELRNIIIGEVNVRAGAEHGGSN